MLKKIFILLAVLLPLNMVAQDLLKLQDLSKYKVEVLTDADVLRIRQQLMANKLEIDQVRPLLLNRGLTPAQFEVLKARIEGTYTNKNLVNGKYKFDANKDALRKKQNQGLVLSKEESLLQTAEQKTLDSLQLLTEEKPLKPVIDPRIFGSELFNKTSYDQLGFESDLTNLATPVNYEIGPGDQLKLVVFGKQELDADVTVTREGNINIPNVGLVKLAGLTIESAQTRLKKTMQRMYPTLNGGSNLLLTVADIRTIRVTVIGANKPGAFNIPSLAGVYYALTMAGGPISMGSFRTIELVRDNKLYKTIDLYRLLSKGDQSDDVRLKDNDIIRIPSVGIRVEMSGQVKRPGLFEALPNENLAQLISYAGGFDDTAYTAAVKVYRRTDREREVKDVVSNNYTSFSLNRGDVVVVAKSLDRYANRVKISGAVFRPDDYEFQTGMKVQDLIIKADGLREDAFLERAVLVRQNQNLTKQMLSIDLAKAIKGDAAHNIALQKEDELLISSLVEMKDSLKVTLLGEVHIPGDYHFIEGMTLKGLILQAGGFTDASSANIDVAHLIVRDTIQYNDTRSSNIQRIVLKDTLSYSDLDVKLQPYDVITVRKKPVYDKLETVLVVGQVQFPGPYALSNSKERVSDLYERVGGVLPDANIEGAYLKRFKSEEERKRIGEDAKRLQQLFADSAATVLKDVEKEYDRIPLDLEYIMKHPGSTADVILKSRDELIIPKTDAQVRVSGAVLQSTQIPFENGKTYRTYISAAGGFARDAWRKSSYIIYANGKAASTKHFLFFRNYPKVKPGAEIIVPKEPTVKSKVTTGEIIGVSSALASLAGVVIAILKL